MSQVTKAPPGRQVSLSGEGMVWFLSSVGLLAVGVSKNINLLSLLGCMMACLLGLNLLLPLWRSRLSFSTIRVAGTPVVGIRHPVEIFLHPEKTIKYPFQIRLDDSLGNQATLWHLNGLPAGPGYIHGFWNPTKRGWIALGPLEALSRYPFGLAKANMRLAGGDSVLVHPATALIQWDTLLKAIPWSSRNRRQQMVGSRVARPRPFAQEEFHAMRNFRPGDSPRLVHWRTSARKGLLIVREFEDPPNRELVLEFDPLETPDRYRESAISFVASFLHGWFQQGHGKLSLRLCGSSPLGLASIPDLGTVNLVLDWLAEWTPGKQIWPTIQNHEPDGPPVLRIGTNLEGTSAPSRKMETLLIDFSRPETIPFWSMDRLGGGK
ncbi:MAG: DUF58 domain-containing protein [Gemmataceae bacterium]|nr:DUF58 domain-containing protein [Gemmataceae bacterium]